MSLRGASRSLQWEGGESETVSHYSDAEEYGATTEAKEVVADASPVAFAPYSTPDPCYKTYTHTVLSSNSAALDKQRLTVAELLDPITACKNVCERAGPQCGGFSYRLGDRECVLKGWEDVGTMRASLLTTSMVRDPNCAGQGGGETQQGVEDSANEAGHDTVVETGGAASCAVTWGDCTASGCCGDMTQQCLKQGQFYSQCRPFGDCPQGWACNPSQQTSSGSGSTAGLPSKQVASSAPSAAASSASSSKGDGGLSGGAVAAIAIVVSLVALIALAVFCCYKRCKRCCSSAPSEPAKLPAHRGPAAPAGLSGGEAGASGGASTCSGEEPCGEPHLAEPMGGMGRVGVEPSAPPLPSCSPSLVLMEPESPPPLAYEEHPPSYHDTLHAHPHTHAHFQQPPSYHS